MIPNGIDTEAPVISYQSAVIDAPPDVIWELHTGVDDWPDWQPDIETARLDGPFAPGSTFSWHTSGLDIESTIHRVEAERRTLWGGPAHGIAGIHEWTFTPVESGVRVDTTESWSGEPIEADTAAMQEALDGSPVRSSRRGTGASTISTAGAVARSGYVSQAGERFEQEDRDERGGDSSPNPEIRSMTHDLFEWRSGRSRRTV